MVELKEGDRVTIVKGFDPTEIRDRTGKLLVRFLPGYIYRVTRRNKDHVTELVNSGRATVGGASLEERVALLGVAPGKIGGKVTVKPRKRKK